MMNINDIPQELLSQIREQFEAEPKIRQMRVQQQIFIKSMKFKDALEIAKDIESLFNNVVFEYIEENRRQVEKVDVKDMDMPIEDKENLMKLFLVCFMCADIIETSVMDMDDILHKYDKDLNIETFSDIKEVFRLSKEKLKYLQKNCGYMKGLVWADRCDNMYQLIKNKAGSIMRKNATNHGEDRGYTSSHKDLSGKRESMRSVSK